MPAISKLDSLNGKTRQARKQEARTEEAKEIKACYAEVDKRDQGRCRVCGKRGSTTAVSLLDRLHRHHMIYRSRGGEHIPAAVITLCATCHGEIHVSGELRLEGDANVRDMVTFKFCGVTVSRFTESGWKVERVC